MDLSPSLTPGYVPPLAAMQDQGTGAFYLLNT